MALDGPWRFRTGDAAAYASPALADSAWATVTVPDVWTSRGGVRPHGFAWYRGRLVFDRAPGRPLGLQVRVSGMAIEVYADASNAAGDRPPDVLARRLLEAGATKVTVYSNVVTVEAPEASWATLEPKAVYTISHLFEFYGDDAGWSFEARGVEAPVSKVE